MDEVGKAQLSPSRYACSRAHLCQPDRYMRQEKHTWSPSAYTWSQAHLHHPNQDMRPEKPTWRLHEPNWTNLIGSCSAESIEQVDGWGRKIPHAVLQRTLAWRSNCPFVDRIGATSIGVYSAAVLYGLLQGLWSKLFNQQKLRSTTSSLFVKASFPT